MSLFQELKRRRVVRTTVAYLAAAFVAAQAAELLVDGLELPSWILKAVLVGAVVGLPLVVGLAWAFDITAAGVERTDADPSKSQVSLPWRRIALPVMAALLLLVAAIAFLSLNKSAAIALNQDLVAVMPFRVSGDPQMAYLREGMVDLLAAKLTGEGGPRAADPRAVMSAVKQETSEEDVAETVAAIIGRKLGAGKVLVGSVVGTSQRFQISAKILYVPNGQVIAQDEETGSADSLLVTVDRLTAKLLSLQAGEGSQRLEVLTTTSLPALRAFLDGQAAYRSGHFGRATELFGRAVDIDSTFALAALGQELASGWGEGPPVNTVRIRRIMHAHRDRLGPVDRALVNALVGEEPGKPRSIARRIAAYEAVAQAAPDRADAWFAYGDIMVHWGRVGGYPDAIERSDAAFGRVLELDSTYMPALSHRMDNAFLLGSIDVYRKLEGIRQRRDPEGSAVLYQRPARIHVLGDSVAIAAQRAAIDTMGANQVQYVMWVGGTAAGAVDDAVRAIERRLQLAVTRDERKQTLGFAAVLYLGYGMPNRAASAYSELLKLSDNSLPVRIQQILAALYANGDSESARAAAQEIPKLFAAAVTGIGRVRAACALEQWRLWNGEAGTYQSTVEQLARIPLDSLAAKREADICTQVLAVINSIENEPTSLATSVRALDALLRDGPPIHPTFRNASNIVLARAAERAGDRKLAYQAMNRIPWHPNGALLASTMDRESARLAALNGDTKRAIRGYTSYLLAHERAEPALKAENDAARAHLAQLTGER